MNIDRKQILETCIRVIDHISDVEYQQRIWIEGKGPEADDYEETVCYFFPEVAPILLDYKAYGLSKVQYQKLKAFNDEFQSFEDGPGTKYYFPKLFIDMPEWKKVMDKAKEVLKAFNYKRT
jgi:hypothetical protein